jgi:hypothetical protein
MKDATSHPEMSPMMLLRARTAAVLLAAALAAPAGACLAQGRDAAQAADATGSAGAEATMEMETPVAARGSRSAFGKVMGLMIGALQRQSQERAHPVRRVRTTAAGTPIGIEVGAAFRDAGFGRDASDAGAVPARATAANRTGTGGAAVAPVPRAAPPEDPGLRQAVVAGSTWIATSPQ